MFFGTTDPRAELPIRAHCPKVWKSSILPTPPLHYRYRVSGRVFVEGGLTGGGGGLTAPPSFCSRPQFLHSVQNQNSQRPKLKIGTKLYLFISICWVKGGSNRVPHPVRLGTTRFTILAPYPWLNTPSTLSTHSHLSPMVGNRPFQPELQPLLPPLSHTPSHGDLEFPPLKIKSNPWRVLT
jgi:hypothetical protein